MTLQLSTAEELPAFLATLGGAIARDSPAWDLRRFTAPQLEFLRRTEQTVIWRGPNQYGKSWAAANDVELFATGRHPFDQTHQPPVRIALGSDSWSQFDPLARKLWQLVDQRHVRAGTYYQAGQGIRGAKYPVIEWVDGPGKGSVVVLFTYEQGTRRAAGGTFDRVVLDEPCPANVYSEMRRGLNTTKGHMRVMFTPTPDTADRVHYLREKIEEAQSKGATWLHEMNPPLTPENCTVHGGIVPWRFMSQADIDAFSDDLLEVERGMRIRGDWSPSVTDQLLRAFTEARCVRHFRWSDGRFGPPKGCTIIVSADHGANRNKQAVSLEAIDNRDPTMPRVWVVDQVVYEEWATPEQVAADTLAMIERHGLGYDHVDEWVGDRPTGANKWGNAMDNKEWRQQMARLLKRPLYDRGTGKGMKWIHNPVKSSGSSLRGFRAMNTLMKRGTAELSHWIYHPRCQASIKAAQAFNGDPRHPAKDVLDADRYGMERGVNFRHVMPARLAYG
jgi:phage terminase large subunit-like protein